MGAFGYKFYLDSSHVQIFNIFAIFVSVFFSSKVGHLKHQPNVISSICRPTPFFLTRYPIHVVGAVSNKGGTLKTTA